MTRTEESEPALPELEQLLVHAARSRAQARPWRNRAPIVFGFSLVVCASAAAATTTGILSGGHTQRGPYAIQSRAAPASSSDGVCLQLREAGDGPAYGCGHAPTPDRPFGLVIADSLNASPERVIYGLVSGEAATVRVLGRGAAYTTATTTPKPGLPGRFFTATVPNSGRIELLAIARDGSTIGHIGNRANPRHPPRSQAEAVAQGNPAGFAPAIPAPTSFTYQGHRIKPSDAARRGLVCTQNRRGVNCTNP
jgi:hypothetical protein